MYMCILHTPYKCLNEYDHAVCLVKAEMCMDKLNFDKDQFNQCVTIFVGVGTNG